MHYFSRGVQSKRGRSGDTSRENLDWAHRIWYLYSSTHTTDWKEDHTRQSQPPARGAPLGEQRFEFWFL
jgi:hypothetical protein